MQVSVFPHDDWEELDIEGGQQGKAGAAGVAAPSPAKPSRCVSGYAHGLLVINGLSVGAA
jgi:hypothetical protein